MTSHKARELAGQMLSARRYRHVCNVADAALVLARRYGADEERAALAAYLHDIVKEMRRDELLQLMRLDAIMAGSTAQRPLPVWHGPCGAIFARHRLGVQHGDVLSAIACHTTGKAGMSLMDKVIFTADLISAERDFSGVDTLRTLAKTNLDLTVITALEQSIAYVQATGRALDSESTAALRSLTGR